MRHIRNWGCGLLVGMWATVLAVGQAIPPITDLSAAAGPVPGSVTMDWTAPNFATPGGQFVDAHYEFRYAVIPVTDATWDIATPVTGLNPGAASIVTVALDLNVMAATENQTIHWDKAYMRAWLTVTGFAPYFYAAGIGIPNQTIQFSVKDASNVQVWTGNAVTDKYGMATVTTSDLYNGAYNTCAMFHFRADWAGATIGLSNGMVITSGSRTDTQDMNLCELTSPVPPLGMWSRAGGVYTGAVTNGQLEFTVPQTAVTLDTQVQVSNAMTVPPPTGMKPSVPGALLAFNVVAVAPPQDYLNKPINMVVRYPASLLNMYGGVGESSMRGYWYNPLTSRWELCTALPLQLDREDHVVGFGTTRLGMFAIAAETDGDLDGLGDAEELAYGTSNVADDTDHDGVSDGAELWVFHGDPLQPMLTSGNDQWARAEALPEGVPMYVATRIVTAGYQSPVSNSVAVTPPVTMLHGDLNCDGAVNNFDIDPFVVALIFPNDYAMYYPACDRLRADMNLDALVNNFDIDPFVGCILFGDCP